ncbi:hypothetical protein AB0436_20205 [Streptomyces sp. NPDC051322]|uniref:hypothetical protein n=1 Tax=Streptomyces sp. NPDC051322 TaxID=3154645 RepID=UPI00344C0E69
MRPDDGGGDFRGINPDRLGDLIKVINTNSGDGASAAQSRINSWSSHAHRLQMDTTRLSKMTKHLNWAHDQLPMLRRRHSLAMDEEKRDKEIGLGGGMVSAGAGDIGKYKTQSEAQKAAKKDAKAYKDGDMDLDEYMKKLEANQTDPDYCKAAMAELGDTALYRLEDGPAVYDPDNPDAGMFVLANTVATAMRAGTTFKDDHGNEDLQHLSQLVGYADFPTDVVANLGKQCLAPGNYMYGEKVWEAMGNDPAAATKFLHDNMDVIPAWMKDDSDHHGGLPDFQAKAFAGVIAAGTLNGMGADANVAADNTTKLIQYYAKHSDEHTHSEVQAVFAKDIAHYFPDVQASLTDPGFDDGKGHLLGLGKGHVTVSSSDWKAFTSEAMQNADAGAKLLVFTAQQADEFSRNNPNDPVATHASGVIEGFFTQAANNVYQQMVHDKKEGADEWKSKFQEQANAAADTVIDVALDPQGAAKTVAVSAVKDVIHLLTDAALPDGDTDPPKAPMGATWDGDWQRSAGDAYVQNGGHFKTVKTPDGLEWNGDPKHYASMYDCPNFLNSDGRLELSGSDQQQMAQRQAYNAWLKDPAVGGLIAGDGTFTVRDLGRHDGEDMAGPS